MKTLYTKDPAARKDYTVDWTAFLGEDTIASVTWTVPTGLTTYSTSDTDTTATIWLTGGTPQTEYLVTCQITTEGGVIEQQSFQLVCRDQ